MASRGITTASDWKDKEYSSSQTFSDIFSGFSSGLVAGAATGNGVAAFLGGLAGAFTGWIGSIFKRQSHNDQVAAAVEANKKTMMSERTGVTVDRNKAIRDARNFISNTKNSFDTTYGSGMFDQYDAIFMNILGQNPSDSLSTLLSNMQYDKVSGEINTRLAGKVSDTVLNATFSLSDINSEYLTYLQEQLRAQDTVFGEQMSIYSQEEANAYSNYYDDVYSMNLQFAQQFESAFFNQQSTNISQAMSLGSAEVSDATSGFRNTGDGSTQSSLQKFQQDLSDVAYSSTMKYMLAQYGINLKSANNNLMQTSYEIRNNIRLSTKQQLNNLVDAVNQTQQENIKSYDTVSGYEEDIDYMNEQIEEDNKYLDNGNGKETEEMDNYL